MDSNSVSLVVDKILPPKVRIYVYAVVGAACTVLVVLGKITQGQASDWMLFAGTILGIATPALALANRPQQFTAAKLPTEGENNAGPA